MLDARDVSVGPPGASDDFVVKDFSLRVGEREWVAITGPNGSGKTTLILALAGLISIRRGTIELEGRPLGAAESRRRIAVILQDPSVQLLQSTVADELAFTALNLGTAEDRIAARVRECAETLGLTAELRRDPATLSAGRQQLVLIGSALVSEPRFLIADEACAHLDRAARERVLGVVREGVRAGMSVVWVTQSPEECAAADRTIVLENAPRVGEAGERGMSRFEGARGVLGESVRGTRELDAKPLAIAPSRVSGSHDAASALFRLEVAPGGRDDGPRVSTCHPIAIDVPRRGIIAVIGRNGSGKSVLLAAVAGLVETSQISVAWESRPENPPLLASQYPDEQIFEERVVDEITYAARSRGLSRDVAVDRARASLAVMDLGALNLMGRRSWELSSGEKRVVQVVGTLIAPSSVVLLDEPTCGLDPVHRAGIAELIRQRADHVLIFIASQDEEWIEGLGARRIEIGAT